LKTLEWEMENKSRERRRNYIIIRGMDKWEENKIEQEVKEFIKESLKWEGPVSTHPDSTHPLTSPSA